MPKSVPACFSTEYSVPVHFGKLRSSPFPLNCIAGGDCRLHFILFFELVVEPVYLLVGRRRQILLYICGLFNGVPQ